MTAFVRHRRDSIRVRPAVFCGIGVIGTAVGVALGWPGKPWQFSLAGWTTAVVSVLAVRARLDASAHEVVVRNTFRTHRIPTSAVRCFYYPPERHPENAYGGYLLLESGRTIAVRALEDLSPVTVPGRSMRKLLAELNAIVAASGLSQE